MQESGLVDGLVEETTALREVIRWLDDRTIIYRPGQHVRDLVCGERMPDNLFRVYEDVMRDTEE